MSVAHSREMSSTKRNFDAEAVPPCPRTVLTGEPAGAAAGNRAGVPGLAMSPYFYLSVNLSS